MEFPSLVRSIPSNFRKSVVLVPESLFLEFKETRFSKKTCLDFSPPYEKKTFFKIVSSFFHRSFFKSKREKLERILKLNQSVSLHHVLS